MRRTRTDSSGQAGMGRCGVVSVGEVGATRSLTGCRETAGAGRVRAAWIGLGVATRRPAAQTGVAGPKWLRSAWIGLCVALICGSTCVPSFATSLLVGIQDRRLDIDASFAPEVVENDQTSIRATYTWNIGDAFTVVATGGGASSYLGLNDTRLNGATDLRLRALYRPNDYLVLGAGSIVPMGLYELSANEVTAAQWVWNPRSGFPLSRFGEGWGWELTSACAFPISENLSGGIAAAYLHHAEFDLLGDDTGLYRLGPEISVSGAVDWRFAGDRSLLLNAAYRMFGNDELLGVEFLEKGDQVALGGTAHLPVGAFVTRLSGRMSFQGDNSFALAEGDTLAISESGGTRYGFDVRVGRSAGESVFVYLDGLYSVIGESDYAIPINGSAFSVGPGVGWRVGPPFSLGARFLWVDSSGDDDLSYTGTDILVTLEYRP